MVMPQWYSTTYKTKRIADSLKIQFTLNKNVVNSTMVSIVNTEIVQY